ncbi:MAG: hypothetical protein ACOY3D_07690, partial [Candidatus Omnitrophota bacterium]
MLNKIRGSKTPESINAIKGRDSNSKDTILNEVILRNTENIEGNINDGFDLLFSAGEAARLPSEVEASAERLAITSTRPSAEAGEEALNIFLSNTLNPTTV